MANEDLKTLLEEQGKSFEAFKETHEELKNNDVVTAEKLERIEKSLDAAVEQKAAIDAKFVAEQKEREDLEARLQRANISGTGEDAKAMLELAEFNMSMNCLAKEKNRDFAGYDATQYGEYKSAFGAFLRKNDRMLSDTEVKILSAGSDPDGGYFVTPDITGRIAKLIFETSPMRQVASVQTISTDKLEGEEDLTEAGAGYAGETSQGSDTTTPQTGKWAIQVYWIDTEPKATQQLLDDSFVDIEAWISRKVGEKFARFESAEFVAGSTGKIRGLTSYTTAADDGTGVTWGTMGHVVSGKSGGFADSNPADKFHDLMGTLKSAYLPNAMFMTRRTVITEIRKFKDGTGNYIWQPSFVLGVPETIMGHGVIRAEDMPTLAANSLSLAFGDFREGYQIVDRQGIRVLRDPFTGKPFVKFYTTKRVGGGMVNFEAVKLMKFTT